MGYKIHLSIIIISLLSSASLSAAERSYRVELLVLRHLEGTEETDPEVILRDFSEALDLMPPVLPDAEAEEIVADEPPIEVQAVEPAVVTGEDLPDAEVEELEEEGPRIVLQEEYSDIMQQAWRRLRSSAGFRPEFYLSWEQPDEEPFEVIRVHDLELLFEDDPYADLRAELLEDEIAGDVPVYGDVPEQEKAQDAAPAIPDPFRYYRIDGTARLVRSRFLHLYLDIEFREPDYDYIPEETAMPALTTTQSDTEAETSLRPPAFRVHTLKQNRQVQTRNLEYFDGPVLAVLALISRIDEEPADESVEGVAENPTE